MGWLPWEWFDGGDGPFDGLEEVIQNGAYLTVCVLVCVFGLVVIWGKVQLPGGGIWGRWLVGGAIFVTGLLLVTGIISVGG